MDKHFTTTTEGELLSISAGKSDAKPCIILSVRLNKEEFASHNIGLSPDQAVRLWRDLCHMASNSDIMKKAIEESSSGYDIFKQIILEDPVVKKK